ncbi:iron chelate uptake ABC transporter family permease subunit [Microbacteriaceae bacterium VKM Ac-2855]|nr:iron chelate uptake ABC transporter family permease subunit [Microbacteriaceae bacterium VKM Ac-2855]
MTALAARPVLRLGALSVPVHRRSLVVVLALAVLSLVAAGWALTLGDYPISFGQLITALTGGGEEGIRRIVLEWRLPRILMALIAGAALGLSGAIFQSLTRNPLGSPDIIGFNTGAYTGALVVLLIVGGNYVATAAGALIGGLATALIVYVLAYRRGVQGFRLIVVGLAISAILAAVNTFLKLRASLEAAIAAASWGVGSLTNVGWKDVVPVLIVMVVLVPCLVLLSRRMHMLALGDDAAKALGIPIERTRLMLLVVGVAFTAAATAVAGPISFVALAAPQLAHRLTRSAGLGLTASAAMGALLLLVSDIVAQRVLAPVQLPVGAVTVTIGGIYLIGLLIAQARRK